MLAAAGIRTLEVIRVADAAIEDTLSLDVASVPSAPQALMYGGSWRGDRIVANSDRGLVVLNTRGGLHFESVFATPGFPHGIAEPVFTDDTPSRAGRTSARSTRRPAERVSPRTTTRSSTAIS